MEQHLVIEVFAVCVLYPTVATVLSKEAALSAANNRALLISSSILLAQKGWRAVLPMDCRP